MKTNDNLITLDDFVDKEYGNKGVAKRDKFEQAYNEFKVSLSIQDGRPSTDDCRPLKYEL